MTPFEQIAEAIQDGGIVLTANQRLSRTLRKAYDEQQAARGLTAWESPLILPLSTWLRARWSDAQLAGAIPPAVLLSAAQQELVWRRIIGETPEGASLLDLRGTARSAMEAWRLVEQYRLPLDARFSAHEDWAAFRAWALAYQAVCGKKHWLDEARLADSVRRAMAARAVEVPGRVLLAGFDELTPQQQDLAAAMDGAVLDAERIDSAITRAGCPDSDGELRNAALWARGLLREGAARSIGIVLLRIGMGRGRLERIFGDLLDRREYHISIPDPLAGYPLVNAALLALRMAPRNRWAIEEAGLLLRSPFLRGGSGEAAARASADARLRRRRRVYVTPEAVVGVAGACPEWAGILERWRGLAASMAGVRPPSGWNRVFENVLEAAGWPGDVSLSSPEYQAFEAWQALLGEFASLDAATEGISYGDAVARMEELAEDSGFQPQDPGAPIQIMGALEAAGARFDALWICGATDEAWPAPAHPQPFLPLSLQQEHRLPHSSPDREMEFAVRTFARLRSSAPRIVVSWAGRAGDVELRPSPLIEAIPSERLNAAPRARALEEVEYFSDEVAPPLETAAPKGGTRILEKQSACPFQAFAYLRLGAQPLEAAEPGLSAADRGSAIHEALRLFWEEVRDQATLLGLTPGEVREIAGRAAAVSLRKPFRDSQHEFDARFRELEIERFTKILVEWAELEKTRAPFRVAFSERERTIALAGLNLAARIDRVDELPDGRQVILDYKATAPSVGAWGGERPDEPQLPLYAISNDAPVAALAFAQVGPDGLRFRGLAASDEILPGVKAADSMAAQIVDWRRVLEPIAASFRDGFAAVDPKKRRATCERCGLTSLCRVYEMPPADVEETDAEA